MTRRGACVAVAVSGGRDSTALLHATARAARDSRLQVVALHVHHGLMPQADDWLIHLQRQCARWTRSGLPLTLSHVRLEGAPAPGQSVEAWARRERYRVLAHMARAAGADTVLLAHHRRDQAETVLLQALRGGGPRGWAAMPRQARRDGITWLRPWLDQPGEAIEAYVRRHRLTHVTDGSNADPRFARSRVRTAVWPVLATAFPGAESALAAAAARSHEAAQCLAALADIDADLTTDGGLLRAAWLDKPPERRANVLRHWTARISGHSAAQTLINRLLREWPLAREGARWPHGAGALACHAGALWWLPARSQSDPDARAAVALDLRMPGRHALPGWSGEIEVRVVETDGIAVDALREVRVGPRTGGEQFQRGPRTVPRALKKAFQAAGVAAWLREGPLLWLADGRLAFVAGLGVDARVRQSAAPKGGLRGLAWHPGPGT